jgi:putative transposase
MQLTAQVKLLPTPRQAQALQQTLEVANAACNYMSDQGWEQRTFCQFPLHKLVYHAVREKFDLTAQVVVRCVSKVADAYKADRKVKRTFKPHGAIAFDNRILSYNVGRQEVSIWTVMGRERIPFVCGERQIELLSGQRGESDLCYVRGNFYLLAACDVATPRPIDVQGVLGVDLGIVNLATDSDGLNFSGAAVERNRRIFEHRRRNLQKKQTKSAKRKLKKISGKQARFQRDTNHTISKVLVQKAQDTCRALALEDLSGIRKAPVRREAGMATGRSSNFGSTSSIRQRAPAFRWCWWTRGTLLAPAPNVVAWIKPIVLNNLISPAYPVASLRRRIRSRP